MNYYLAINGQQQGPFPPDRLLAAGLTASTLVWAEGMPQWQRADSIPELAAILSAAPQGAYVPPYYGPTPPGAAQYGMPPVPMVQDVNGKKIAAGVLGIILGGLGIHKFILGFTGAGLTMLLISVLLIFCTAGFSYYVMHLIGLIEGIIYLCTSDAEFYRKYFVERQSWF